MKQISKIDFDPSNGGQEPRSRGTCQSKGSTTLQSTEHLTNNGDPSIDRTVPTDVTMNLYLKLICISGDLCITVMLLAISLQASISAVLEIREAVLE